MGSIPFLIFQLTILLFSVMLHEVAHGYAAERLGDPTARLAGRLTFNPLNHIDPFGSILLPTLLVLTGSPIVLGWAKPVPYNPNNLYKDYKYGPLKVALAGPATNFAMLGIFGLFARFGAPILSPQAVGLFGFVAFLNTFLAVFNLMPIPPLDGSKILTLIMPREYALSMERLGLWGIFFVILFLYAFSGFIYYISTLIFVSVAGGEAFQTMLRALQLFSGSS